VSNLNAYLALGGIDEPEPDEPPTPFFVIEIAFDAWEILEKEQRVALVDHELCHCMMDEDSGKLIMHPHDLEEFNAVVRRHGLWQPDVVTFARTLREAEQRNAQRAVEE
jgi:predicted LPLAT superfamily acyltransferase